METATKNIETTMASTSKAYKCETCGKLFAYPSDLKRHCAQHTGVKPHACDICSKNYSRISHLNVHKQSHDNTQAFKCQLCSKSFVWASKLKKHMLSHEDAPFDPSVTYHTCEICGKKFLYSVELDKHVAMHAKRKAWDCEQCDEKFVYKSGYKVHSRSHQPIRRPKRSSRRAKPFCCNICGGSFSTSKLLMEHMKLHTNLRINMNECESCKTKFTESRESSSKSQKKICPLCRKKQVLVYASKLKDMVNQKDDILSENPTPNINANIEPFYRNSKESITMNYDIMRPNHSLTKCGTQQVNSPISVSAQSIVKPQSNKQEDIYESKLKDMVGDDILIENPPPNINANIEPFCRNSNSKESRIMNNDIFQQNPSLNKCATEQMNSSISVYAQGFVYPQFKQLDVICASKLKDTVEDDIINPTPNKNAKIEPFYRNSKSKESRIVNNDIFQHNPSLNISATEQVNSPILVSSQSTVKPHFNKQEVTYTSKRKDMVEDDITIVNPALNINAIKPAYRNFKESRIMDYDILRQSVLLNKCARSTEQVNSPILACTQSIVKPQFNDSDNETQSCATRGQQQLYSEHQDPNCPTIVDIQPVNVHSLSHNSVTLHTTNSQHSSGTAVSTDADNFHVQSGSVARSVNVTECTTTSPTKIIWLLQ